MLQRFELTLSKGNDVVHTFTWGETRKAAYARVVDQIDDPVWEGYSFELADEPTKIKH